MFKIIKRIIMAIFNRIVILYSPNMYAKKVGVNLGENVKFYGMHPGIFGSEPWMITIGNNVNIVSGCNFITHDGGVLILRDKFPKLEITKPIKIGNNVYIGINCTILPGVIIGNNVIIGSGSIVTKNIPDNSVAAGVPAKVIKTLESYTEKVLKESLEFGNLCANEKEKKLKEFYKVKE